MKNYKVITGPGEFRKFASFGKIQSIPGVIRGFCSCIRKGKVR